jgi:arsenate reductase (glutaredoxin)
MACIVYGIANCDTVKKARRWLDAAGIAYTFHDYKKLGADPAKLAAWCDGHGWEKVLNRAGTTFRKRSEADRAGLDQAKALRLMLAEPSMIKRPILEYSFKRCGVLVGFDADLWQNALT